MRLVCTLQEKPYAFSAFLRNSGIDNECEEILVPDEEVFYRIWVYDEDQFDKARELYEIYKKNPEAAPVPVKTVSPKKESEKKRGGLSPVPYRFFSTAIIFLCIAIFLWSQIKGEIVIPPKISGIPETTELKGLTKLFSFDYPLYFELRDQLVDTIPKGEHTLSAAEASLLLQMEHTPYWEGIYDRFIRYVKQHTELLYSGPMFEKIGQGDVWRLFTPALLHYNFLHILFNLLWFIMLAHQIENKVGSLRFLLLILTTAIAANLAQYLMSGSFFMGLSGVVVALVGFIWARQQVAPWEGYLLQRVTILFLGLYVLGIFGLQLILFFVQLYGTSTINMPIANTAHLVGGITGYILGRLPLFKLRSAVERD